MSNICSQPFAYCVFVVTLSNFFWPSLQVGICLVHIGIKSNKISKKKKKMSSMFGCTCLARAGPNQYIYHSYTLHTLAASFTVAACNLSLSLSRIDQTLIFYLSPIVTHSKKTLTLILSSPLCISLTHQSKEEEEEEEASLSLW